MNMQATF